MVEFNSNLGNFNVKQAPQLSKAAEVGTQKAEGKEVGEAQTSAVLIKGLHDGKTKVNDVRIDLSNGKVERLMNNTKGELEWQTITFEDITDNDYSNERGIPKPGGNNNLTILDLPIY